MKRRKSEREQVRALEGRYRIEPGRDLSVTDYAWWVRFTPTAVREAIKRGAIPYRKTQGRYWIRPTAEVIAYIRSRKSEDAEDYMDYMLERDSSQHPNLTKSETP